LSARQPSRSLFTRVFRVWSEYRRLILLALTASGLASMLSVLAPETRQSLLSSFASQRNLLALLLVFSLLTLSLLWSAGQRLDTFVFMLFNLHGHHPLWMDRLMWAATQIGNGAAGILLCILLYFIGYPRFAVEMLLGILSLWLVVELIKAMVERSRPFLALEGTRVIGWRERGKSFPSGHTSQAFFMMTLISQQIGANLWVSALLYLVAVLVAFSRIYVGAHYPRDVMGGAVLGSVWGMIIGLVQVYLSTGQF